MAINFSNFNLPLIGLFLFLSAPAQLWAEGCSESDAFNKMMALGRAQTRMISSGKQTDLASGSKLALETAEVGQILADKKYGEACVRYEAIAKKYKIDLIKEQLGMVTYAELAKDGGKRGSKCGLAEAQNKLMGFFDQLRDRVALGDESQDIFRQFERDTAGLNELMYTNPPEVCKRLDALKPKYKFK